MNRESINIWEQLNDLYFNKIKLFKLLYKYIKSRILILFAYYQNSAECFLQILNKKD